MAAISDQVLAITILYVTLFCSIVITLSTNFHPTSSVSSPFTSNGNVKFSSDKVAEVENYALEMQENRTIFREQAETGQLHQTDCSSRYKSTPTLMFLCFYAFSNSDERDVDDNTLIKEDSSKSTSNSSRKDSNSHSDFHADVLCTKKRIVEDDPQVHRPVRTISCCQNMHQKCTYASSSRGKYIARCHSSSEDSTKGLVECCQVAGAALVESPKYNKQDYKCY